MLAAGGGGGGGVGVAVGVGVVGGGFGGRQRQDAPLVSVGGCGQGAQRGGLVGAGVHVEDMDGLGAVGDRDHRVLAGLIQRRQRLLGHPIHARRRAPTGGRQEIHLHPHRRHINGPLTAIGCRFGEGPRGGGFGAGELGVEGAGVGAGLVEEGDVGLLGGGAAGVDVALGDHTVRAAGYLE